MLRYLNEELEVEVFICENCGAEWADEECIFTYSDSNPDRQSDECCFQCDPMFVGPEGEIADTEWCDEEWDWPVDFDLVDDENADSFLMSCDCLDETKN